STLKLAYWPSAVVLPANARTRLYEKSSAPIYCVSAFAINGSVSSSGLTHKYALSATVASPRWSMRTNRNDWSRIGFVVWTAVATLPLLSIDQLYVGLATFVVPLPIDKRSFGVRVVLKI